MKGLYTEKILETKIPFESIVNGLLDRNITDPFLVEQFCDDGEGDINRYNVYKISVDEETYVLKKSGDAEISVYDNLLKDKSFPVPKYFGNIECNNKKWILLEYIEGIDLRDFTTDMAYACADSVVIMLNEYWQNPEEFQQKKVEDRFERYWKRICKRAECLLNEPNFKAAYDIFLERQLVIPRTLCNGDFLQYNGIYQDGKIYLIDWAFAGIMPYSLDIARLIAHGTEDKRTFPFYMNEEYRQIYVEEVYKKLNCKPEKERYHLDIKLSLLNEYIEFIERELNDSSIPRDLGFEYYYGEALKVAKEILEINSRILSTLLVERSSMNLTYRKAEKVDADLLIEIYNDSFYDDYLKYGECPAYGRTRESMEESIEKGYKWIIYNDENPIGAISVVNKENGEYYLGCLCVIPVFQGNGIGTKAIQFMLASLPNWMKVTLITPADKQKNIDFYTKKCGFQVDSIEMDGNVKVVHFIKERSISLISVN